MCHYMSFYISSTTFCYHHHHHRHQKRHFDATKIHRSVAISQRCESLEHMATEKTLHRRTRNLLPLCELYAIGVVQSVQNMNNN